jgi:cell wall-associated NlpC family hydrolase
MKARMIKVAALLLAGALTFSVAYINPVLEGNTIDSEETADGYLTANAGRAGITDCLSTELTTDTVNTIAASGVSGVISAYMSEAETVADVAETDTVMTTLSEQTYAAYGYTNLGVAEVDEGNLNVREAPGTDASIVGKMPNHAGCEILGVEGEWTKISSGKVEGYVKSEYLLSGEEAFAKAEEVQQTIATVTTTTLYVREEPNTDCSIITSMPMGEELEVVELLDGWVKINVDSDEGYVSADYVEVSTELAKAMTMTEVRYGQGVSDVRVALVQYATQFVGNPYVWGGTSLTKGADCSGFVLSVFANYGISLPHSSSAQANCGTRISASEAQPGDLFFYGNGSRINHVAIYIGNGRVVHASSPKSGIKISSAYYRTPVKVVRILNN